VKDVRELPEYPWDKSQAWSGQAEADAANPKPDIPTKGKPNPRFATKTTEQDEQQ